MIFQLCTKVKGKLKGETVATIISSLFGGIQIFRFPDSRGRNFLLDIKIGPII